MPEGMSKPYNGNQDFSSLAESAWDIPYQYLKESFNNYVELKLRWRFCVHASKWPEFCFLAKF